MHRPDVLDQWLQGEGLATIDHLTGKASDVVGVIDTEYVVRYVNYTTPGLDRAKVIGQSTFNLIPLEDQANARAAFDAALHHGRTSRFEMFFRGDHGVLVWVVGVGPIMNDGRIIGALTISTDATEQRREFLDRDRFFSLSLDMLVVATPDALLRRVNPAFSTALGYDATELANRSFVTLLHPDDVASFEVAFKDVLAGKHAQDFENRYRRRDREYRTFSWRATVDPLTGDVYAVARDVTEHRATEAQLRHAQKMEAIGQLAGGVAHDFNNLMQSVLANVELALLNRALVPALADHLHEIESAGRRAAELTKQLLLFSRRQTLNRVTVDLDVLLRELMKLLRRLLPESIAIELKPNRWSSKVSGDRTQLEQVIVNLAVNARDAMEAGGLLTLETGHVVIDARDCELHPWARPGRFVRLTVTDTGTGISPEVRERIFDPFFTTKGAQQGTGLGLATVYGIVQQHGGFVYVYSELGEGTTFKVYLPADDRGAVPPDPSDALLGWQHGTETILIAEDEELVRKPVLQILESAGYKTLAATNGREAVELLRKHADAVDLIVLDVVMPELGGPESWEQMRAMRPGLRVLFTSGYADDRYRERLPPGAEVVEKPFRAESLLRRIRAKLDG
jgi:two-component system cell cycle sensor histidine kinase/response regulator CckA